MKRIAITFALPLLFALPGLAQDGGAAADGGATATDSGSTATDSGSAAADSGTPPAGDAGSGVDAGPPPADGGVTTGDGGAGGCGTLTYEGECVGSLLRYCLDDTEVVEAECSESFDGTGVCREISTDYGYDCAAPVGGECAFDTGQGLDSVFCDGTDPGCSTAAAGSVCTENLGACTDEVDDDTCQGTNYVIYCWQTQPWVLDCPSFGGTCAANSGCTGIAEGGDCDGSYLHCADGLVCDNSGTCAEAPETPDAGPSNGGNGGGDNGGDDNGDDEEPDDGCGCNTSNSSQTPWGFGLASLMLFAFLRRRR
jgi:MYXO-CTERM domain-containing protein